MFSRSPFRHLLWLLLPLHACNDPTYVTVRVTTDVPCERLQGVTLTVGKLGAIEDKIPTTRTAECNGSEIGTLTVVPSAEDDGEFGIRVLMGIGRDVETCTAPAYGDGCVVARRGLRFLPGESVELPIVMRQICNGIPCGPYDTCVKGSCVPATCKDTKTCTEDKLSEGGESVDGGGGDAPSDAPVGPENEPVSLIEPYCGTGTALDANAAWAIRRGCVTRAGVSRFRGPEGGSFSFLGLDSYAWTSVVIEDGPHGWGTGANLPRYIGLESPPVARGVFIPVTMIEPAFSPAILPQIVLFQHRSGYAFVPRTPNAPDFPKGDFQSTNTVPGGPETYLSAWVPYPSGAAAPNVLVVRDGQNASDLTYKVRRVLLAPSISVEAQADILGTKFSDPALSPDGNRLYVASESEVHAFDPKTVTSRWALPAETGRVGLVDRQQNFHTVVFVRPDGAPSGNWVLRSFQPEGAPAGTDVTLVEGALAGAEPNLTMALALIPGSAVDIAVVSDGSNVLGIDLTSRTVLYKKAGLVAGRAQIASTPNLTYLASLGKLSAITPADGNVVFDVKADWMLPTDIAVGPNRTLYVTDPVLFWRAVVK